jgi:hypothetical protein
MKKVVIPAVAALVALAACGGSGSKPAATPATPAPTTAAPTTSTTAKQIFICTAGEHHLVDGDNTTICVPNPTTVAPTTTTAADPFNDALRAAGFTPKADGSTKTAVQTYCDKFDKNDHDAMQQVANETQNFKDLLKAGFAVLCPANVPFIGTMPTPTMPNGDALFTGYPKIVKGSTIDYRVRNWYQGKLTDDQVVALAPGVYTPYNPNVPDLNEYLSGPADGDCAMKNHYFPDAGGACWNGVK